MASNMADTPTSYVGSGVKRKHVTADDALYLEDEGRSAKRISPFLNTPIQRKEAKRRILRVSMRKMREIDCPESFLRRSVLINNLARSLQDDLKDDKLWSRWDWTSDMETLPCRTPAPDPADSRDVGEPPSACRTPPAGLGPWALGAHAHWLGADDGDGQMSASERERVSREMTQSDDRLAAAVDGLASFDADYPTADKRAADAKRPPPGAARSAGAYVTSAGNVAGVPCSDCDVRSTSGSFDTYTSSAYSSKMESAACLLKSDVNKNKVPPGSGYRTKLESVPSLDLHHLEPYPVTDYVCTLANSSASQQPVPVDSMDLLDPSSRYPDTGHLTKMTGFEKDADKDPWTLPCLDYPDELGTTYLDMTSNSVCRVRNDSSILDSLDSCIPELPTAIHSATTGGGGGLDVAGHVTGGGGVQPLPSSSFAASDADGGQTKPSFTAADVVSPPVDVGGSAGLWNASALYSPDGATSAPCATTGSLGATVSCSAEAERPEYATSLQYADQDRYSSQSLRDFDVIYNNLVSVLIGGN